jgi:hypothetical protein
MRFDGQKFGAEIVALVKSFVERKTGLLENRVAWLEQRISRLEQLEPPPKAAKSALRPIVRVPGPTRRTHNGQAQ